MTETTAPSFVLPQIYDNPDGSWGPSPTHIPPQFKDIPYSPYSKGEKLGRFADWAEGETSRGAGGNTRTRTTGGGRPGRQGADYPAAGPNAFAYFHAEDEASFSLVDNRAAPVRRGLPAGANRGRGTSRGGAQTNPGRNAPGAPRYPQGGSRGGRGGVIRRGWKDWDKVNRARESSVPISPDWSMLEEIDFPRLSKLRLDVSAGDAETLSTYGQLYAYNKDFDRITPKTEKPLQILDRLRVNTTTSDDPVIQSLAGKNSATVFTTDTILSWLMCSTRSVYPWDVIITHENGKVFFDKRDGGPFDFVTVNENAADPPMESDKERAESINSPGSLSLEATFIDQHFAFQAVNESATLRFKQPNPFTNPYERETLASCGYQYKLFDLSVNEEEEFQLICRTQVEAFLPVDKPGPKVKPQLLSLKTLNEFDSKAQGAGGAPDWRSKLDTQRGAVVATEMKNNSFKLSRYAVQSILAGAEAIKIGYVSRVNPRDNSRHATLMTQTMRPMDFATQLGISLANGWGIVRMIVDKVLSMPEGKFLLIKDPNKSLVRLYSIPATASFGAEADEEAEDEE